MTGELVEEITAVAPAFVCVSVLSMGSTMAATQLSKKLRDRINTLLAIGVWGSSAVDEERRRQRLKRAQVDRIFSTLTQAASEIRSQPVVTVEVVPPKENAA
jgi:hypothetical protein